MSRGMALNRVEQTSVQGCMDPSASREMLIPLAERLSGLVRNDCRVIIVEVEQRMAAVIPRHLVAQGVTNGRTLNENKPV